MKGVTRIALFWRSMSVFKIFVDSHFRMGVCMCGALLPLIIIYPSSFPPRYHQSDLLGRCHLWGGVAIFFNWCKAPRAGSNSPMHSAIVLGSLGIWAPAITIYFEKCPWQSLPKWNTQIPCAFFQKPRPPEFHTIKKKHTIFWQKNGEKFMRRLGQMVKSD